MIFQVTAIEFDFEDDEGILPEEFQKPIIEDTIGQIWEADDEEDLVEEITCATGWCIKSIDYRHVLSWIMKLSPTQLDEVIEKYCDRVIDEMDTKAMEQMLYEMMVDSFKYQSENDVEEQISAIYGEEYWQELVEDVTADTLS